MINYDILWQVFPRRGNITFVSQNHMIKSKSEACQQIWYIKSAGSFQVSSQEFLTVLVIRASFYIFLENKLGMFLALRLLKSQGEILVLWAKYLSEHFRDFSPSVLWLNKTKRRLQSHAINSFWISYVSILQEKLCCIILCNLSKGKNLFP